MLPRLFLSMLVVIGVMWVAARVMKNRQVPGTGGLKLGQPKKQIPLQVLARQGLGRHSSVTIVRAGDKALVLGITETQISLLSEMSEADLQSADLAAMTDYLEPQGTGASTGNGTSALPSPTRTGLLEQIRERTVRKD